MTFTGERYIPNLDWPELSYEHWHRYLWATAYVGGKTVLDIACGEGYGAAVLAQTAASVMGVDSDAATIRHALSTYQLPNVSFAQGSASAIPIEGEGLFDVVVSFETIEHLSEQEQQKFLREVRRLLRPNGQLLISTPNVVAYNSRPVTKNEFHLHELTVDEFVSMLRGVFEHVGLVGQRVYPVSYMWPLQQEPEGLSEYQLLFADNRFWPLERDGKESLYVLAVCTNETLPPARASVLVDTSNQLIQAKNNELVDRIHAVNALKARIAEHVHAESTLRLHLSDELKRNLQHEQQLNEQIVALEHQLSLTRHQVTVLHDQGLLRNRLIDDLKLQVIAQDLTIQNVTAELSAQLQKLAAMQRTRAWRMTHAIWRSHARVRNGLRWRYQELRSRIRRRSAAVAVRPHDSAPSPIWHSDRSLSEPERAALQHILQQLAIDVPIEQIVEHVLPLIREADITSFRTLLVWLQKRAADDAGDHQPQVIRTRDLPGVGGVTRRTILFVAGEFPNPLHGGGGRLADTIRALSRHHDIYLYAWYQAGDEAAHAAIKPYCRRIMGVPLDVFERYDPALLHELIAGVPIDIVHYDWPRSLPYASRSLGSIHIYTSIEVVSLRLLIDMQQQAPLSQRWCTDMLELLRTLKVELVDTERLDACAVLTEKDGLFLARLWPKRSYYVVDTGLDVEQFYLPDRAPEANTLMFVGNFNHYPNEDAVRYFFDTIYEHIRARIPQLKVYIVGAHPTERVRAYHDGRHVVVTGTVEDVKPYIQRAQVCVAPLVSGAGIRTKVNQYAALKRPCVVTSLAAVDLDYEDGRDIFIADDPQLFAERVIELLQQPKRAHAMGLAAYSRMVNTYSLDAAIANQQRLYEHLLARQEGQSGLSLAEDL